MSGRLIILRHKSWHVWNQDNIEKVKLDERLAKEEADKQEDRKKRVDNEFRVNILKKRKRGHQESQQTNSILHEAEEQQIPLKHVNFFEDEEREANRILGTNPEYEHEEKERKLKELKQKNMAPWALGEGSAEKLKACKPWYHYGRQDQDGKDFETGRVIVRDKILTGVEAQHAKERRERRKCREDPMSTVLHTSQLQPKITVPSEPLGAHVEDKKKSKKHKKTSKGDKSRKKSGKEKKRSHKKAKKDSAHTDSALQDKLQKLEELRRQRMIREKEERSKAVNLLAERQMAGLPVPGERERPYNSQFNPMFLKQRKR